MTLVDTSAWISFTRADGSDADRSLTSLIEREEELFTTDIVALELLAGARDARHLAQLRQMLGSATSLGLAPGIDAEQAADIYRRCRRGGETPRQLTDCLIAAVAIRNDLPVLHNDRDFETIARHTELRTLTG